VVETPWRIRTMQITAPGVSAVSTLTKTQLPMIKRMSRSWFDLSTSCRSPNNARTLYHCNSSTRGSVESQSEFQCVVRLQVPPTFVARQSSDVMAEGRLTRNEYRRDSPLRNPFEIRRSCDAAFWHLECSGKERGCSWIRDDLFTHPHIAKED
jgi:hypothetical protein